MLFLYCSQYLLGIFSIKYMNFKVLYIKLCLIHTVKIYLVVKFFYYILLFFAN